MGHLANLLSVKLGLQGVSVFIASGDYGVSSVASAAGASCLGPSNTVFSPAFPANCPWVTTVGATKIMPGNTVADPESAPLDPVGHPFGTAYYSGGGFSNFYAAPSYQTSAVSAYFAEHDPGYHFYSGLQTATFGTGLYNRMGRGTLTKSYPIAD